MKSSIVLCFAFALALSACVNNDDVPPPSVSNVMPSAGAPGSLVTITGGFFCQLPEPSGDDDPPPECEAIGSVDFGSTPGTIAAWSDDQISVEVPNVGIGTIKLTVTARGRRSNAVEFVVENR